MGGYANWPIEHIMAHHHCNVRDDVAMFADQIRYVAYGKGNVFGNSRLNVFLCEYNAIAFRFIVYIFDSDVQITKIMKQMMRPNHKMDSCMACREK